VIAAQKEDLGSKVRFLVFIAQAENVRNEQIAGVAESSQCRVADQESLPPSLGLARGGW
jgi:hypothetical protein